MIRALIKVITTEQGEACVIQQDTRFEAHRGNMNLGTFDLFEDAYDAALSSLGITIETTLELIEW